MQKENWEAKGHKCKGDFFAVAHLLLLKAMPCTCFNYSKNEYRKLLTSNKLQPKIQTAADFTIYRGSNICIGRGDGQYPDMTL